MPRLGPIRHADLGFILPNPHHSDIGKGPFLRIPREAVIDRRD
jgi:hypothetical protein